MNVQEECPLCGDHGKLFYKDVFFRCDTCKGVFRSDRPDPTEEKARYEAHDNDVNDRDYRNFVDPITRAVKTNFTLEHKGLDFGAGTGPVISKILQDAGYDIKQYDPFFHDDYELLKQRYHYIVCCEVMEHFHDPYREFKLLKEMLLPGGHLYCMTYLYRDDIDFHTWGYKEDFTHIFFYQKETLEWIKHRFGFSKLEIDNRLIDYVCR